MQWNHPRVILQWIIAAQLLPGVSAIKRLLAWKVPVGVATGLMVTLHGRLENGVLAVAQYR